MGNFFIHLTGKRIYFALSAVFYFTCSWAQESAHADLLRYDYCMEQVHIIDCDSTSGSDPEHAICIFKDLLVADSLLAEAFDLVFDRLKDLQVKSTFVKHQEAWLEKRKYESYVVAIDSKGWYHDILILSYRLLSTQKRIEELEYMYSLQ